MTIRQEDLRALTEIGFIAWSRGLETEAGRIFDAIRVLRPKAEAGYVGGALTALRRGDAESAVQLLRKLPSSEVARAFLGLALVKLGERREGLDMLQDVSRGEAQSPARNFALSLLASALAPAA